MWARHPQSQHGSQWTRTEIGYFATVRDIQFQTGKQPGHAIQVPGQEIVEIRRQEFVVGHVFLAALGALIGKTSRHVPDVIFQVVAVFAFEGPYLFQVSTETFQL